MSLRVACIQMDIEFGQPEKNRLEVEKQMEKLFQEREVDVVVLPELWTTGYDLTRLDEIADDNGEDTHAFIADLALKYQTNIVAGSIAKKSESGITNTLYSFNRKGECVGEYSKVHLFQLMDEHHYLASGESTGSFELEGVSSAGLICYDIRFPEWVRTHTTAGAEILYVVAEWPLPRLAHWRALLISRAIENQCYVVACNRAGKDPNNIFAGHSIIIDPWGDIVAEAEEDAGVLIGELDLSKVKEVRKQIPIFQDRRPELY